MIGVASESSRSFWRSGESLTLAQAFACYSCVFWIKYEPFFAKIPTPISDCPPPAAAGNSLSRISFLGFVN